MRSVSKLKVYVPVLTMSLGYVLTVLVEARSGLKFPGPPTFASGLCLSCRVIMGWWVENAKVVKKFKDKSLAFWKHHWNHWKRYQTLRASVLNLLSMKRITQKARKGSEFRMSGSCVIFFNGLLSQTIHVLYTYHIISHTHTIYIYIIIYILPLCPHLWKYAIDWKHIHQLSMANIWGTWIAWLFLLPSWRSPFGFVGMQPCGHRLPWYNFAHGRPTEERRLVFVLGRSLEWKVELKSIVVEEDEDDRWYNIDISYQDMISSIAICILHPYTFKMYCCMVFRRRRFVCQCLRSGNWTVRERSCPPTRSKASTICFAYLSPCLTLATLHQFFGSKGVESWRLHEF